ncbi:MAG: Ig-like domain-containing protein, partial [Chloroflexota bacterium]
NLLSEGGELYNRYTDMPGCFLNIERRAGDEWTRWLDAGGPGDRVDVAVSFYHPLLTPLGLAEFLPIHGRRSARVEAFRSASAPVGDPDGSGGGGGLLPSGEEATPEDTDTPTPVTPSSTPTETPTVTPSRIPEEAVFDCANIELVPIDPNEDLSEDDQRIAFQPGRVVFLLRNTNNTPARLRAVDFHWSSPAYDSDSNIDPIPGYPTFFFDRFELDGNAHWDGTDPDPETNTLQEVGEIVSQAFEIPADTSVRWAAIYRSGPTFLNEVIPRSAFTGTSFTVVDPLTGTECPTADLTFTSTTNTVEAESTPVIDPENDCASNTIEFGAVPNAFQDFGWVQLYVTNQRDFPATIQGFEVTWGPWEDRQESGSVRLQGVYVGGSTPPSGVLLWSAQSDDGVGITNLTNYPEDQLGTGPGDLQNEYAPVTEADGVWTGGYSINPNTTETIWLDFNGDNLADDRNMILSDLNNTRLIFDCNGDGGTNGNGGGGNNDGRVTLINQPEPEPTVDRRNDPPVAQDNTFNVNSSSQQFSIGVNQSILNNDSDCFDDTPSRLVVGTPCGSIDNVRDDGTVNGDGVTATVRNNAQTDKGGRISINADGTFTYDPTTLNDDSICTATQVTDTYNYQIVDGRGATSTGLITFNVNITDSPNNRPESTGNHPVLATFDTANGNVITGSTSQFNQMFSDPDGHSLSYSKAGGNSVRTPGSSFSGPDSAFSINGGQWRFEIPSDAVNAVDGTIIEYQVYVTANDGQSKCNTEDSYFRIRVEGSGDIPPTNTPPPTSTPDDSGGIGPGGGLGG